MRFSNIIFAAFLSVGLCSDYEESLKSILQNQVDPNDGSSGVVTFNTTGYGLEKFGIDADKNFVLQTYSSYNYLKSVSELADVAFSKGYDGDLVMLYYKFIYGGQHKTTSLDGDSDMLADIATMVQKNPAKRDAASLVELLTSSSSIDTVKNAFEKASKTNVNSVDKRWTDLGCDSHNMATLMNCRRLLSIVKDNDGWNYAQSTSLNFEDCFISWNELDRFQYKSLYPAADACFQACSHGGVSCRVCDVYLSENMPVCQCMSNRGDGC